MQSLKTIIETRFSLILLAACLAGLLLPGADRIPTQFVTIALAIITFFSFFRATWQEVRHVSIGRVGLFYVARFLVLPIILFGLSAILVPAFSSSIFLLALLPSGVMSAAISMMFSGNVAINFIIFIASTLLAPFTLPILFETFGGSALQVETADFFRSLLILLIVPFLFHLPARKVPAISGFVKQYAGAISTILVALIIIAVVGEERDFIYGNPAVVFGSIVLSLLVYAIFHASGWYLAFTPARGDKIAFSVASGVNQLGLGISLAFLYFSSTTAIFMVSSNLAWVGTIALSKWRIANSDTDSDLAA